MHAHKRCAGTTGINRIDADHYDRSLLLRRRHLEELANGENDPTLKPLD